MALVFEGPSARASNAEDYREMLRGKGIGVDAPDREEWEWSEHGGSHARVAERPVR